MLHCRHEFGVPVEESTLELRAAMLHTRCTKSCHQASQLQKTRSQHAILTSMLHDKHCR